MPNLNTMDNNTSHPTLDKIKQLKEKFTNPAYNDDVVQIDAWESNLKDLLVRDDLAGKPSIMQILKRFSDEVADMNSLLLHADSKLLSDGERDRVLDKRKLYQDFLGLFNPEELSKAIQAVDKDIDEELQAIK